MNEWVLAGIAIVGTVVLVGGGAWLKSVMSSKRPS